MSTRTLLAGMLVAIFVSGAPAQGPDIKVLVVAASSEDEARLQKILKRYRGNLFDIVATGFRTISGVEEVAPLIAKIPEDYGRAGIESLSRVFEAYDKRKRSRWGSALRTYRKAEGLLFARGKKKRGMKEAILEITTLAPNLEEPWLRARATILLLCIADKNLGSAPEAAAIAAANEALTAVGDQAYLGLALLARARLHADAFDEQAAKADIKAGMAALEASGRRASYEPAVLLRSSAQLAVAELLVHTDREAEALPLLRVISKVFKEDRPVALRTARLLEALCKIRTGAPEKAAAQALRLSKQVLKETIPQIVLHQAWLAAKVMRLGGKAEDAIPFLKKARAILKLTPEGRKLDLPLRYESGLSLLVAKKSGEAVAELLVLRKLAATLKRPNLARLALQNLALHEARKGSKDTWNAHVDELKKVSLGDPEADRLQAAAFNAHLAVALMGTDQIAAAVRALLAAKSLAEDLGFVTDELPGARALAATGNSESLEDQIMDILPFHPVGRSTKALAYGLLERRRLLELGHRLPPLAPPAELGKTLERSRTNLKRITLSWSPMGRPVSAEEARDAIYTRKTLVASCRKEHPDAALRLFPKPVPLSLINHVTTRHRAAFLYVYFGKKASCVYAVSGSFWNFVGISPKVGLRKHVTTMLEALDGKKSREEYLFAAGQLHKWLVQPMMGTLGTPKRVFVISAPELDGLNLGLLVPDGTKGKSWELTPFLLRDKSWAEIPAVSLLTKTDNSADRRAWSTHRRFAALHGGKPGSSAEMARLFDDTFKPSQSLSHERIRLVKSNDLARCVSKGGKLAGFFRDGGFLHVGTAASLDPASLATAGHYHPEAMTLSVPPRGIEDRNLWIRETLLSGTELVLVPRTGKGDPRVFDAVIARFWRGMSGEGFNPGQALAAAQRAFLLGRLMPGGKKTTDKDRHPSNWGNLQLMLRRL